ncbi:hypothetical protein E5676_scaffold266G00990 [Cucumis melo var. makuwa]|uniref:Uncharacterized protein n=1 Tax=Cucumis melo var. makuwa TaxID=1194695 RepID=A0A5D3DLT1_CUCMM|nr:hypothetical protein E6C27_scaffold122G002290 [Cucumis melo var. makuwa]TYK24554.1 hypothetical protein E5676_scaffold266G00990 [Cucumis melo var. makuwa]
MASLNQLPRHCSVEKKEFVLSVDKRSRESNLLITEVGPYKSFSIAITPDSLEWLKMTFKALLNTPRTTRFFVEKRYVDFCLWVQKIHNRRGYIAEIYRVDDRGRKCCILVPEGLDKTGWALFNDMLTCKKTPDKKVFPTRHYYNQDKGKEKVQQSYDSSTDSETPRKTYVEAVSSSSDSSISSSSESDCSKTKSTPSLKKFLPALKSEIRKEEKKNDIDWEKSIILSRRCFHDDWAKIIDRLKDQTDKKDSCFRYIPFHADKALLFIKDKELANLLCKNIGWTTVGPFYVKFEKWSKNAHADTKVIPSYGGWTRFRGIPLHIWNLNTFIQIGEACGGFIDAAPESINKLELTEALIKVKENYTGFLPAFIQIHDEEGQDFIVQTITHPEGKWLRERNPSVHGSFTKSAAEKFNEFNPYAEQYTFRRNFAVIAKPDLPESSKKGSKQMNNDRKMGPTKTIKKFNKSVSFLNLNYEGDSDSSNSSEKIQKKDHRSEMTEKKKGKQICSSEYNQKISPISSKRKVSFSSPKNETFLFSAHSAPTKTLKLGSPMNYAKMEAKSKRPTQSIKKKVYRVKSRSMERETPQTSRQKDKEKIDPNEFELVVDLGHISPLSDTDFSCPESPSYIPSPTSPTESDIVKDSLASMMTCAHEDREKKKKENLREEAEEEEVNFKRKLTDWLKENNLRLAADFNSQFNSVTNDRMSSILNGPPNVDFENVSEDVIDGKDNDTMGPIVFP